MRGQLILVWVVAILLLGTFSWPAMIEVASPPLRFADDTRSAFCWAGQGAGFPQAARVRMRVTEQHRAEPNPWEVAWVVLGNEEQFIAFVAKPNGWHVEVVDARAEPYERFLASGSSPSYPVGEAIVVSIAARGSGIEITADSLRTRDGRQEPIRLSVFISWSESRKAPAWWGEPVKAGIYVEDCAAEVEWFLP